MNTSPMCDDLANAEANRKRVKEGYGNQFYDEQAHCLAQWTGEKPPENLILGELPYAGKIARNRPSNENGGCKDE